MFVGGAGVVEGGAAPRVRHLDNGIKSSANIFLHTLTSRHFSSFQHFCSLILLMFFIWNFTIFFSFPKFCLYSSPLLSQSCSISYSFFFFSIPYYFSLSLFLSFYLKLSLSFPIYLSLCLSRHLSICLLILFLIFAEKKSAHLLMFH